MKKIKGILDISDKLLEYLGMIFLVCMVLIVSLQVFTRQFLSFTPYWAEEVSLILMVWFGFIGIAIGVKKGIHLSIEYFVGLTPRFIQRIIIKFDDLAVCFFGMLMVFYGSKLVNVTGGSTLPATQWPSYMLYIIAPVSGVMIICYSIAKLFGLDAESRASSLNTMGEIGDRSDLKDEVNI